MKFSEHWLRTWVNPAITTEELAADLTMAGLEVDAIEAVAPALDNVVVGQVISLAPHPDADKLRVCQVDVGEAKPLTIVCGAPNVQEQGRYPVAKIGAQLPGGLKIKKAKLRGVESHGMLCSAKELSLAEQAEGLMTLPDDAPVAMPVSEYLQLDDHSIELGLTPNRGDCLSIKGIAREVGVLFQKDVAGPEIGDIAPAIDDQFPVQISAGEHCPRYVGRVIRNINPQANTPMWMQERLRRCGIRSISASVDVTNYVLLELGQPMHAFDLEKLSGGIDVRLSRAGETLELLDGQSIELTQGSLVIADKAGPQALAGIMGGNASAVNDATQHIFLESAFFKPGSIAGRARSYGLHTDSSHRFERGVDPALQGQAIERATQLLLEIVGGEAGPINEVAVTEYLPQPKQIHLRYPRVERVLGRVISKATVEDILTRLGMQLTADADGWTVIAPLFRFDIEREIDLIEEIARIYGYSEIPSARPRLSAVMQPQSEKRIELQQFQAILVQRGYQEAITYSFVDPTIQTLIDPEGEAIALANPISADLSVMRTSLWPGLLQAAQYNLNRQQDRIRIFESGLKFLKENNDIHQVPMLAGLISGTQYPQQWGTQTRDCDFFDLKGDVEAILTLTGSTDRIIFSSQRHTALHPGQSAKIVRYGQQEDDCQTIGWIGTLHPAIEQKLGLPQRVYLFEIQLSAITTRDIPQYQELSKFPAIKRDLAIVVDESITTQNVHDCILEAAPGMLTNFKLFDVYRGKGIDSGRKSLAYSLTLQNLERTLTDEEVESVLSGIMQNLNKELGATLRD
jgi:phenylalanyl-tRNA synthetase beta chain